MTVHSPSSPDHRKPLRFSGAAVQALLPIFVAQGYSEETCRKALEAVRFYPTLFETQPMDWRQVFLAGARLNGVTGITLGDKVFLASPQWLDHAALLAHEAMHVVQQRHRHLLPFLAGYGWQWLRFRIAGMSGSDAYLSLSDEREARAIEASAERALRSIHPWLTPA